jgi:hypothetical protein
MITSVPPHEPIRISVRRNKTKCGYSCKSCKLFRQTYYLFQSCGRKNKEEEKVETRKVEEYIDIIGRERERVSVKGGRRKGNNAGIHSAKLEVLTTGTMKLCSCYVLTTFNLVFPIVSEK